MIKGVIFDIDGVLLDSLVIWNDLGARYLISLGIEPEEGLNEILFSMSMEEGAEYLEKNYSSGKNKAEILSGIQKMLEEFYFYEVNAKNGALDLMKAFEDKGIPMVAATSSPREHVTRALGRNGLLEYIKKIYTSSEVGSSKSSPDIYNAASEYLGTKPDETYVFEDSLYALITAKKAGYKTVGVYDELGEHDQDGMKENSYIYVKDLTEFNLQ